MACRDGSFPRELAAGGYCCRLFFCGFGAKRCFGAFLAGFAHFRADGGPFLLKFGALEKLLSKEFSIDLPGMDIIREMSSEDDSVPGLLPSLGMELFLHVGEGI